MGGKSTDTGAGAPSTVSRLFGPDGLKGVGSGIQQASQNYLQQQAQDGDPNAAGIAAGSNAVAAGLKARQNQPVGMTKQINMPSVIPSPMNNPPPPNLFVPSGSPTTTPMFNPGSTGLTLHQPITSPMFNPGSTGFTMPPPIT